MRGLIFCLATSTLLLTSCAGSPKPSLNQIKPICTALVGPIRYNSTVTTSTRFAGKALVPDLKQRNQIGQRLGCPAYR